MQEKQVTPLSLSGEELDKYLAEGWFRTGQGLFTTWFHCSDAGLYSTLRLRLRLRGFQFSKRNRKLMRRNQGIFQYQVKDMDIDKEKEDLFEKYKLDFRGGIYHSLQEFLFDDKEGDIYHSKEINVYHNDRLVAYSFFDLGKNSLASIQGVYDPNYKNYSLGYYTMLLEIIYGMEQGYEYYYVGYITPGYSRFDYKARVGAVDYFDMMGGQWLPYHDLQKEDIPVEILKSKLKGLQAAFKEAGMEFNAFLYPLYQGLGSDNRWGRHFLQSLPLFLMCRLKDTTLHFVSGYDLEKGRYVNYLCFASPDLVANSDFFHKLPAIDNHFKPMDKILEIWEAFPPAEGIAQTLRLAQAVLHTE